MPSYERTETREPNKHTWAQGHNGCCKSCVKLMENTANKLADHIEEESKAINNMAGQLDVIYTMAKWAFPAGAAIILGRIIYLLWPTVVG